jgi:hypothetical protein
VDEPHGRRPDGDGAEPSHRPGRRLRRLVLGGLLAVGCGGLALAAVLAIEPAFYRSRAAAPPPGGAEPLARRLLTKASALRADFLRPGEWSTAVTEQEINAWLATDLPRNHPRLLPPRLSEPRVAFGSRQISVGGRLAWGPVGCVGSFEAEVVLRAVNQVGIVVRAVRLGGLPLPAGPVLRELARRFADLGLPTELRRLDGRTVLVVYMSPTAAAGAATHRLESLAVEEGELLLAGTTQAAEATRR